jgi:hypothetical protein
MPTIHVTDRAGNAHTVQVDNGLTLMEPLRELDDGIEAHWRANLGGGCVERGRLAGVRQ